MDRVSGLSKTILHDILSRLPQKDAVRTSILSKAWRETWYTFPILSISDTQIIWKLPRPDKVLSDEDLERKRMIFLDYMNKTLLRFSDRGLAIKELKLRVDCFGLQSMSQDMDLWMKLASKSGIEVLELCLPEVYGETKGSLDKCYTLQPGVLEAKMLNKLVLEGGIRVDQAFLNHSVKSFSLQVLSITNVHFGDEGAMDYLISRCPLIESITVDCCSVYKPLSLGMLYLLKSFSMHGLQKLKEVKINGIQEVYIDAPNLEKLCYCPNVEEPYYKLNFDSCRNLRCLMLQALIGVVTDQWFLDLFDKFPLLESLILERCCMLERLNISSAQLKILKLHDCSSPGCFHLKELKIDAPKLLSFSYNSYDFHKPDISFLRSSSQLEVNVNITNSYCRYNLREIIESFKPHKFLVSMTLSIYLLPDVVEPNLDVLLVSSPPPRIKHLNVMVHLRNEAIYLPLVNRLLASCCPETISFSFNSSSKPFIEFFYETLMGIKKGECYCSSGHRCWWHDLKDVKVTSSVKIDENLDVKTMLDSLPTSGPEYGNVSLRLEL